MVEDRLGYDGPNGVAMGEPGLTPGLRYESYMIFQVSYLESASRHSVPVNLGRLCENVAFYEGCVESIDWLSHRFGNGRVGKR